MISGFFVQTHQAVIPSQETKKPAVVAGAGFAILWMLTLLPVICPTSQTW